MAQPVADAGSLKVHDLHPRQKVLESPLFRKLILPALAQDSCENIRQFRDVKT